MIAPLRTWHRRIVLLLALLLPLLALLALGAREPDLPHNDLPAEMTHEADRGESRR